ncbi:MAG: HIT family protein [Lachnospiraceae bacterium]|nr:HIT family protein [Lachnospiraceae bacterium]
MIKEDCIFCKIAKGDIPSATIYESNDFKCILDVAPANRGHALIIPKEHSDNIYELDAEMAAKVFSFATVAAKAIKEETGCDGLNIIQNNGEVAGQTVNHFHMHIVPRFKDDEVKVTWKQHSTESDAQNELAKAIKNRL